MEWDSSGFAKCSVATKTRFIFTLKKSSRACSGSRRVPINLISQTIQQAEKFQLEKISGAVKDESDKKKGEGKGLRYDRTLGGDQRRSRVKGDRIGTKPHWGTRHKSHWVSGTHQTFMPYRQEKDWLITPHHNYLTLDLNHLSLVWLEAHMPPLAVANLSLMITYRPGRISLMRIRRSLIRTANLIRMVAKLFARLIKSASCWSCST